MAKMLKMLRYIFISLFLGAGIVAGAQVQKEKWQPSKGFTLGVNLAGPVNKAFDKSRSGISFLSRMSVKDQMIFLAEAGYENVSFSKKRYHYTSNGTFLKAGLEYDVFKEKEAGSNDNLLFGLHYGYALQEQSASYFIIENGYWDDYTGSIGTNTVNTHWIELTGGPRMELFKNFYMAWTFHLKVAIYRDNPNILAPYLIPGFGNGDNRLNAGFSYTMEYLIPWKKGKTK